MKNLIPWLILATISCLLSIFIFSHTLPAAPYSRMDVLSLHLRTRSNSNFNADSDSDFNAHSNPEGKIVLPESEILEIDELCEERLDGPGESPCETILQVGGRGRERERERGRETLPPGKGSWFGGSGLRLGFGFGNGCGNAYGYGMVMRDVILVIAVGNPMVVGGVVGLFVAFFRGRFGGRVWG